MQGDSLGRDSRKAATTMRERLPRIVEALNEDAWRDLQIPVAPHPGQQREPAQPGEQSARPAGEQAPDRARPPGLARFPSTPLFRSLANDDPAVEG